MSQEDPAITEEEQNTKTLTAEEKDRAKMDAYQKKVDAERAEKRDKGESTTD
jgi:hypothetical protein